MLILGTGIPTHDPVLCSYVACPDAQWTSTRTEQRNGRLRHKEAAENMEMIFFLDLFIQHTIYIVYSNLYRNDINYGGQASIQNNYKSVNRESLQNKAYTFD